MPRLFFFLCSLIVCFKFSLAELSRKKFNRTYSTPSGPFKMRIHLYQNDIEWENPERNISAVNETLGDCIISSGDLVILPEMFSTGFQ